MKKHIGSTLFLLTSFIIWTAFVSFIDIRPIGPEASSVGLATLNNFFHNLSDVHMSLYLLTDWLSLIPLVIMVAFALFGLSQWVHRKKLWNVDRNLLILGGFYFVVLSVYAFFEIIVINYRPVLINGILEASYPSSTTMLVLCVMPTTWLQLKPQIKSHILRRLTAFIILAFTIFMLFGRLVSGVHWISDIIGGCLISAALVSLYSFITRYSTKEHRPS